MSLPNFDPAEFSYSRVEILIIYNHDNHVVTHDALNCVAAPPLHCNFDCTPKTNRGVLGAVLQCLDTHCIVAAY